MRPKELYRRYDSELYQNESASSGLLAHREAEDEARNGSGQLLEAVQRSMRKFAWRYGVSENDARILLMDTGVRLPKPFLLADKAA